MRFKLALVRVNYLLSGWRVVSATDDVGLRVGGHCHLNSVALLYDRVKFLPIALAWEIGGDRRPAKAVIDIRVR